MKIPKTTVLIAIILLSNSCVWGQSDNFKLIIDYNENQLLGHWSKLPVYFVGDIRAVDSLDLLIKYHAGAFNLKSISFGDIIMDSLDGKDNSSSFIFRDTAGLAMYKALDFEQSKEENSGIIKVHASMGNTSNLEYDKDNPGDRLVLFMLNFMVTNDRSYRCVMLPVQFIWESCGDNAIYYQKNVRGNTVSQSAYLKDVFIPYKWGSPLEKYLSIKEYNKKDTLKIPRGYYIYNFKNVDVCLKNVGVSQQKVYFFNGGADIDCDRDIDENGDMNLNGVAKEIVDLFKFRDYFLMGDEVFTVNKEAQYAASDVNLDSKYLTLGDFEFLIRIIQGDAVPFPKSWKAIDGQLLVSHKKDEINLRYKFDAPVGCVLLRFNAPDSIDAAELKGAYSDYEIGQYWRNDTLSILIYSVSRESKVTANTGPMLDLKYTGQSPKLISVEGAGYYGEEVDLNIIKN